MPDEPVLNKRLDEIYDLVRREHIGQSSFGVILEVRHKQGAGESLALKVLQTRDLNHLQECLGPEELQKRGRSIQKEIAFLSDLEKRLGRSPGDHYILPLLDAGLWHNNGYDSCEGVSAFKAGFPAFVMSKGLGLSAMVSNHFWSGQRDIHPVGPLDLLRWTLQIATALSAVHSVKDDKKNRFMHRDIKPSNLLLMGKDLYVIDFGIVKAPKQEGTGSFMGSEEWMAPERVIPFGPREAGRDWDLRFLHPADLYSLGLVFYWMVTVEEDYAYLDSQVKIGALLTKKGPREDAYLKRGKLGGMNDRERKRLKARLHTLFNVPKTVEGTGVRKVADKEPVRADVAAGVCDLIEQLLTIEPDQRPTAETVVQEARRLIQLLIITEKLTIEAPSHAGLKTSVPVTVCMAADWVPEGTDWLEVTWGGQKAQKIEATGPGQYTALLPGLEKEGRYEVCSAITLEGVEAELPVRTVQVSATADQLWAMGQHAQALIRDPDREEWLVWIRNEARGDGKKCCEWVEVLEEVYYELEERSKLREHSGFTNLFSELELGCKAYKSSEQNIAKKVKDPNSPPMRWKRWAGLVVLLVLLAGLGLGYGLGWDWRKYFAWESMHGDLVVKSIPSGADVYLQGDKKGSTPLSLERVAKGRNKVKVISFTNETIVAKPEVEPEKVTSKFTIKTQPPGAEVFVNGLSRGTSPTEISGLEPGKDVAIRAAKPPAYEDSKANVPVVAGKNPDVMLKLTPILVGLAITSKPADAEVTLKGSDRKYIPGMRLPAGVYGFSVSKPGYETFEGTVTLRAAGANRTVKVQKNVKVELPRLTAKLWVETEPKNARVRILKIKPKFEQGMALAPGRYEIEVSAEGYETRLKYVMVGYHDLTVHITLARFVFFAPGEGLEMLTGKEVTPVEGRNQSRESSPGWVETRNK
ncbi:MAG: PEGA domain-containing protein [Deltaproteobacteria bacterium]|nr:PEGA domain-containing protein [Deltaproteobacteria bacterium]